MPEKSEIVYGIQPVIEALEASKEIDRLLIQRDLNNPKLADIVRQAQTLNIPVAKVPIWKFNKITRKNHQGVLAYLSAISYASLDHTISKAFEEGRMPLVLVLDRITDVRNFGAIARAAECAGVDALVIPTKGAAQIGSDALRTSAGALNHLAVCREKNLLHTVRYLKDSGLQVVSCTEKASETIYQTDMNSPLAIIMGSEEDGISDDLLTKSTHLATIPMHGRVASLNVSVATGIALFEARRQQQPITH